MSPSAKGKEIQSTAETPEFHFIVNESDPGALRLGISGTSLDVSIGDTKTSLATFYEPDLHPDERKVKPFQAINDGDIGSFNLLTPEARSWWVSACDTQVKFLDDIVDRAEGGLFGASRSTGQVEILRDGGGHAQVEAYRQLKYSLLDNIMDSYHTHLREVKNVMDEPGRTNAERMSLAGSFEGPPKEQMSRMLAQHADDPYATATLSTHRAYAETCRKTLGILEAQLQMSAAYGRAFAGVYHSQAANNVKDLTEVIKVHSDVEKAIKVESDAIGDAKAELENFVNRLDAFEEKGGIDEGYSVSRSSGDSRRGPLHADRLAVHLEDPENRLADHELPGRRYRWIRDPNIPDSLRIGVSNDTTTEPDDWKYYQNEVDMAFPYGLQEGEEEVSLLAPLTLNGSGPVGLLCPDDLDEWSSGMAREGERLLNAHAAVLNNAPARTLHVYATSKTSAAPTRIVTQVSPSRNAIDSLRYAVMADCFAGLTKQRKGILEAMKAVSDKSTESDNIFSKYWPSSVTVSQILDAYRDSEDAKGGLEVDRAFAGFLRSTISYLETVGKISEECLKNHQAFAREALAYAEDKQAVIKEVMEPVETVKRAIEDDKSGLRQIITQLASVQSWINKQESAQLLTADLPSRASRSAVKDSATCLPTDSDLSSPDQVTSHDWKAEQAQLLALVEAEEREDEKHAERLAELAAKKKAKRKARNERSRREQEQREAEEAAAREQEQLEHQEFIAQLQAKAENARWREAERKQLEGARAEEEALERYKARSEIIKAKKAARKARKRAEQDAATAQSDVGDASQISARHSGQDGDTASIGTEQGKKSLHVPKDPWGDFEVDWHKPIPWRGNGPRSLPGSISDGDE